MNNRFGRTGTVVAACAVLGAGACSGTRDTTPVPIVAHESIRHAPAHDRPALVPLVPAKGAHVAPPTYAAPIANASVDARILLITANGTDAAFAAIQSTLQYLGTPFDVLNAASGPTL
ncbi:MAG TPA: hypothetical protein VKZ18_06540, partial [Polyangia bacterium]|nr:hypothetical protein [Polyangia bacterium]